MISEDFINKENIELLQIALRMVGVDAPKNGLILIILLALDVQESGNAISIHDAQCASTKSNELIKEWEKDE